MADTGLSPSDEHLLGKAKQGNKAAFEAFYNRHKRRILNYSYRMIGNTKSAEDITQEVFVKAYMSLQRYAPQGKALNWVYTIAGNLCKNFLRDNRFEPRVSLDQELNELEGISLKDVIPQEGGTPSEAIMNKEQDELIEKYIKQLPIKYREVLVLCDIQGHSYEEAARILRCRVGSIGSRLSRARAILAKNLGGYIKKGG